MHKEYHIVPLCGVYATPDKDNHVHPCHGLQSSHSPGVIPWDLDDDGKDIREPVRITVKELNLDEGWAKVEVTASPYIHAAMYARLDSIQRDKVTAARAAGGHTYFNRRKKARERAALVEGKG